MNIVIPSNNLNKGFIRLIKFRTFLYQIEIIFLLKISWGGGVSECSTKRKKQLFFAMQLLVRCGFLKMAERQKRRSGGFREDDIFLVPIASGTGHGRTTRNHQILCQGPRNSKQVQDISL